MRITLKPHRSAMNDRASREEAIGFITYDGDRLPIVNISKTGILISDDLSRFEVGQHFNTQVELRRRGEKESWVAGATVARVQGSHVGLKLDPPPED